MSKLTISSFSGGLSLLDPTVIKDNQFENLQDMSYNSSQRVQSRRGYTTFGSAIGSSPITSYFEFIRDDTLVTITLCTAGTKMYKLDQITKIWAEIAAGLTEYEVANPSNRTRWSFMAYRNKIYMGNGVDSYRMYDGAAFTLYAGQPKYRYLLNQDNTTLYGIADTNPSRLYFSAATPADGSVIDANFADVGNNEQGVVNGIFTIGETVLVGKNKKIFYFDPVTKACLPTDPNNGWYGQRSIANVGNGILYFNDEGINNLQPRQAVTGGKALASESFTKDLQPLISEITPKQYNASCGAYIDANNNYYFSFDTSNDNIPDSTIVRSALTQGWSTYTIPAAYQYGQHIDSDGTVHFLLASATTGQMYEYEYGFSDNGTAINADLLTKQYDFNQPTVWKDFEYVTIYGLISEGGTIYVEILVDGDVVDNCEITDDLADVTATTYPIGTTVIGTGTIGGGGAATINTFPYKAKIPLIGAGGGQKVQVHMYSNMTEIAWTLDKIEVKYNGYEEDMFPIANIC